MYEINGKFGLVRLCRTNLIPSQETRTKAPFSFHSGGWHRCNELYHIHRPHGTDDYLVFFSLTAGGYVRVEGQLYEIPASSIVILPPNVPHEYFTSSGESWEFYWFHAGSRNMEILDDLLLTKGYVFPFSKTAKAGKLLENLFPEQTGPDEILFEITASKVLSDILHILLEASCGVVSDNSKNEGILSSILRKIEENYGEEINIAQLAAQNFISQQHLIRLFKAETGYTPYEYLKKHRLKKAMELLMYSDFSVEQIAEHVGFTGASNFIYQFRNEYGVTPAKYRRFFY